MARLAGASLARAGAYAAEHSVAQTPQRSLLPARMPEIPGLDIHGRHVPLGDGTEVGGDFYDVVEVGDAVLLVMGDVCGKGVEAAALTSMARHTIRSLAAPGRTPSELLEGSARRAATETCSASSASTACWRGARRGPRPRRRASSARCAPSPAAPCATTSRCWSAWPVERVDDGLPTRRATMSDPRAPKEGDPRPGQEPDAGDQAEPDPDRPIDDDEAREGNALKPPPGD